MDNTSAKLAVTAANYTIGFGGQLECLTCHRKQTIDTLNITEYYRSGWPVCHGQTMRWITARQLVEAQAGGEQ